MIREFPGMIRDHQTIECDTVTVNEIIDQYWLFFLESTKHVTITILFGTYNRT